MSKKSIKYNNKILKVNKNKHQKRFMISLTMSKQEGILNIFWSSGPPQSLIFFSFIDLKERGRREKERERNIDVREKHLLVASCIHPDQGVNLQPNPWPRHVSWLAIEPTIFWSAGWYPTNWATPARATSIILERRKLRAKGGKWLLKSNTASQLPGEYGGPGPLLPVQCFSFFF